MTEEEAKARRCCVAGCGAARQQDVDALVQARGLHADPVALAPMLPHYCIASACMGWRWTHSAPFRGDPPESFANYEGHCGRAGMP